MKTLHGQALFCCRHLPLQDAYPTGTMSRGGGARRRQGGGGYFPSTVQNADPPATACNSQDECTSPKVSTSTIKRLVNKTNTAILFIQSFIPRSAYCTPVTPPIYSSIVFSSSFKADNSSMDRVTPLPNFSRSVLAKSLAKREQAGFYFDSARARSSRSVTLRSCAHLRR